MLELQQVTRKLGNETWIADISLTLQRGELTVLLGPTLAGKTSLMRLMAGLDQPDSGDILFDGKSVLGVPVQKRNVAMVYQQFINYPTLSVYDNIASPLVVAGVKRDEIASRVREIAALLQLTPLLQRKPGALSGGQQQRVALARALIKQADLVLLDEPLANLDYKLREELRAELPRLFADMGSVLVYATTEPSEALILGGNTVCLHEGRAVEVGATMELYRRPAGLLAARLFSDPPLNTATVIARAGEFSFHHDFHPDFNPDLHTNAPAFRLRNLPVQEGEFTLGVRPHSLHPEKPTADAIELRATVGAMEFSGSESYVHFDFQGQPWVALLHGIREFAPSEEIRFFVQPEHVMLFGQDHHRITPAN